MKLLNSLLILLAFISISQQKQISIDIISKSLDIARIVNGCYNTCETSVDNFSLTSHCDSGLLTKLKTSTPTTTQLDQSDLSLFQTCMQNAHDNAASDIKQVFLTQKGFVELLFAEYEASEVNFVEKLKMDRCEFSYQMMYGFDSKFMVKFNTVIRVESDNCSKYQLFHAVENLKGNSNNTGKKTLTYLKLCLEDDKSDSDITQDLTNYINGFQQCIQSALEQQQNIFSPPQKQNNKQVQPYCPQCFQNVDCNSACLDKVHYNFFIERNCPSFEPSYPYSIESAQVYQNCLTNSTVEFTDNNSQDYKFHQCQIECFGTLIEAAKNAPLSNNTNSMGSLLKFGLLGIILIGFLIV